MKKLSFALCIYFTVFISLGSLTNINAQTGHIIISVEKFILGQGYLQNPTLVSFKEGETAEVVLSRFLGDDNYTKNEDGGFSLTGIKDTDNSSPIYPPFIYENIPNFSGGMKNDSSMLSAGDYADTSRWLISYNNNFSGNDISCITPENNDVLRVQFSVLGSGTDIGYGDDAFVNPPNKDALTTKIAELNENPNLLDNPKLKTAYECAVSVLSDFTSTAESTENSLNTINRLMAKLDISSLINTICAERIKKITNPTVSTSGGEWTIISLARSSFGVSRLYLDKYFENVKMVLAQNGGVLHKVKYTEYSRVIMALSSIGKSPMQLQGYDILKNLADYDKVIYQGINGAAYALIAMDTKNYTFTVNETAKVQTTRQLLIEYILSKQLPSGGFALSDFSLDGDIDVTAMTIQALAKYKTTDEVEKAIERAIGFLSSNQNSDGTFNGKTAEGSAQVLIALSTLGIDATQDSRFIKNGNDVIDGLMQFYISGSGFRHLQGMGQDEMATDQALCSLVAYERFLNGKPSLYDMSDVDMVSDNTDISPSYPEENTGISTPKPSAPTTTPSVTPPPNTEDTLSEGETKVITLNNSAAYIEPKDLKRYIDKKITLSFEDSNTKIIIPTHAIDFDLAKEQLGSSDISMTLRLVKSGKSELPLEPFTFITELSFGDKSIKINKFNQYVKCVAQLNGEITTACINGENIYPIPTKIVNNTAIINTFSNSTISSVTEEKNFLDVENHWAEETISDLANRLVINGSPSGDFLPEDNMTRAEFVTVIIKALGISPSKAVYFEDTLASDWFCGYVSCAFESGLVNGITQTQFLPNANITREDAAVIIMSASTLCGMHPEFYDGETRDVLSQFEDYKTASAWSLNALTFNVKNGIISEENISLRPTQNITRAEALTMIYRLLKKANLI